MPKISSLTAATALTGLELLPVVQSGTTKKATASQVLAASPFVTGTDIYAALTAAILASGGNGGAIHIPGGTYTCSDTIILTKPIHLFGDSGPGNVAVATQITWAANKDGIRVEYPFQGIGSRIEGLTLFSSGGTTGHGIEMKATALVQDCQIKGFAENGVEILADVGGGTSNANGFQLSRLLIAECGGDGVHTQGGDANGGTGIGIIVGNCGGWGINDDGFLGNTWIGCQSDSNGDAYTTSQPTARSVWVGCYSESGIQGPSVFSQWTLVLGGLHAAGLSGGLFLINNQISQHEVGYGTVTATGYDESADSLFTLYYPTDGFGTQLFQWSAAGGTWVNRFANSDSYIYQMYTTNSTQWNDETLTLIGAGNVMFPNGLYLKGTTAFTYFNIWANDDLRLPDDIMLESSGAVINFNLGDVTITHSSNALTVAGGDFKAPRFATPLTGGLTIATGAITVTGGYHTVDTEAAAASDDLDTISGGVDGVRLVIRAVNSARTVVVKDGTGNVQCAGDFSLDNAQDTIELIYDGALSAWLEIGRSDNGA